MNEVLRIMNTIDYGFMVDGINIKDSNEWNKFGDYYYLLKPEEVLSNRCGVCFDQVELERKLFNDINIKVDSYFIFGKLKEIIISHAFIVYKLNNKYYWFENAWDLYKGIHEYNSLKELLSDVKNKFIKYYEAYNIDLYMYLYNKPKEHIGLNELYKYMESQKEIK